MATARVMVQNEVAKIGIDKANLIFAFDLSTGTKDAVTFQANENCVLRFENAAVFGREYLHLEKDVPESLSVMSPNQVTTFEVFIPVGVKNPPFVMKAETSVVPFSKVWPIVP